MVIWQVFVWLFGILLMWQLAKERAFWFPFCQRKARLSLYLTVPLADSPHMGRMQDAWIWSYTSGVRVSCSDTHTSDKYFPCCSDHILLSGFGILGKPNIPKRSAGQGLSSPTMNRSTIHPLHSFPWGLCRQTELACRESRHSRFAVPSLTNSFWLRIRECLMASCMRSPYAFLRLSLLECSPLFPHLIVPATPWFSDFAVQR